MGVEADPDRVLVCAGVQHALLIALVTLTRPGDWLLTESLTYPGLRAAAQLLHLRLMPVAMDREGLLPGALEAALARRRARVLYCIPTIQNPTTATMSLARRRRLVELARQHDIAIIEDAVHHLLGDEPPPPIAHLAPERTYLVAGMSKTVAGGLRVAYLVSPPAAVGRLQDGLWATTWMASPLAAEVAARWIDDGTADRTLHRKRVEAARRGALARRMLPVGSLRWSQHAYHAWLQLPRGWTSAASTVEGPAGVRLCLSAPRDAKTLARGLERVASVLQRGPG
jgi:DNA-binding transcriptional MocR family regulator